MPGTADASVTGSADPVVAFSDSVDGAAGPVGEPNLQEPAGHARAGSRAKTAADSLQLPSTSTAPALLKERLRVRAAPAAAAGAAVGAAKRVAEEAPKALEARVVATSVFSSCLEPSGF